MWIDYAIPTLLALGGFALILISFPRRDTR